MLVLLINTFVYFVGSNEIGDKLTISGTDLEVERWKPVSSRLFTCRDPFKLSNFQIENFQCDFVFFIRM